MTNSEKSAEEKVKERWPDAFAWQDEDGHWYISLPHLGESQNDDHNALNTQREESAWADAASRLPNAPQTKD